MATLPVGILDIGKANRIRENRKEIMAPVQNFPPDGPGGIGEDREREDAKRDLGLALSTADGIRNEIQTLRKINVPVVCRHARTSWNYTDANHTWNQPDFTC